MSKPDLTVLVTRSDTFFVIWLSITAVEASWRSCANGLSRLAMASPSVSQGVRRGPRSRSGTRVERPRHPFLGEAHRLRRDLDSPVQALQRPSREPSARTGHARERLQGEARRAAPETWLTVQQRQPR